MEFMDCFVDIHKLNRLLTAKINQLQIVIRRLN